MPVGSLTRAVVEATAISVACSAVALGVNFMRSDPLPLVAHEEYTILVPCPTPTGEAKPLEPHDPKITAKDTLVIDARSKEEFEQWHMRGAMHLEFDWLGPPPDKEVALVARKMAASRTRTIVVYGDGDNPDTGREWARLLSGARLKNVHYVTGGAAALNPKLQGASQ